MTLTFDIADLAATEAFGRRLGARLFPGAVVALVGQLGAGKTHLTRAVAEGLGVKNPAAVIPDQRINGPVFLDCAEDDQAWTSCPYGQAIVNLLLNRASPWLDIDSYLPYDGHVKVQNKTAKSVAAPNAKPPLRAPRRPSTP